MSSSSQNKDEITFYYIPYPLVMEKNKWDKRGKYFTKNKPPYKVGDIIAFY